MPAASVVAENALAYLPPNNCDNATVPSATGRPVSLLTATPCTVTSRSGVMATRTTCALARILYNVSTGAAYSMAYCCGRMIWTFTVIPSVTPSTLGPMPRYAPRASVHVTSASDATSTPSGVVSRSVTVAGWRIVANCTATSASPTEMLSTSANTTPLVFCSVRRCSVFDCKSPKR